MELLFSSVILYLVNNYFKNDVTVARTVSKTFEVLEVNFFFREMKSLKQILFILILFIILILLFLYYLLLFLSYYIYLFNLIYCSNFLTMRRPTP